MASVRVRVPMARVPAVFGEYLNQVYAAGRNGIVQLDGQNIFVYRTVDGSANVVDVEFGVGVLAPFASIGPVVYTELPVGEAAVATHWGDYARLGETHGAIIAWCRENRREMTGTRWEVYGHWESDPRQLRTDVYYLLRPTSL